MRVKICGITQKSQAVEIASLGVDTLGFICVPTSPRYLEAEAIATILEVLPPQISTVGVFANAALTTVKETVASTGLKAVQLHGEESLAYSQALRQSLPQIEIIKAVRLRDAQDLEDLIPYYDWVDTILLDAYHPQLLGGTGKTLTWENLTHFLPPLPWLLAGGLNPDNLAQALAQLNPDGIDVSSGVERQPGDKDLAKVQQLLGAIPESSRIQDRFSG